MIRPSDHALKVKDIHPHTHIHLLDSKISMNTHICNESANISKHTESDQNVRQKSQIIFYYVCTHLNTSKVISSGFEEKTKGRQFYCLIKQIWRLHRPTSPSITIARENVTFFFCNDVDVTHQHQQEQNFRFFCLVCVGVFFYSFCHFAVLKNYVRNESYHLGLLATETLDKSYGQKRTTYMDWMCILN